MSTRDCVVFVVDDDVPVLRSLQRLLAASGYAVEVFADASGFLEREKHGGDGCVVTDLRMPGMTGLEFQQAAKQAGCGLPFVFLTGHGQVTDAVQAMKDGAVDFLEKPVDPEALLAAIDRAIAAHRVSRDRRLEEEEAQRLLGQLSLRERQVCELVGEGLLNKQIAARLGTSEKTVKAQRGSAMRKLNATSPAALVDILRRASSR